MQLLRPLCAALALTAATAAQFPLLDIRTGAADGLGRDPQFTPFGLRFVFAADDGIHGSEPWISDGTAGGTRMLADVVPGPVGSNPSTFVVWQGRVWFLITDGTTGLRFLCVSDGTAAGTSVYTALPPGYAGRRIFAPTPVGDRLVCLVEQRALAGQPGGCELWSIDGTATGAVHIDLDPSLPVPAQFRMARLGGFAYFMGTDVAHGISLWRTDGTAAGTTLVADIVPGPLDGYFAGQITTVGDRLWFVGGARTLWTTVDVEPWISDGTAAGTRKLDLEPGYGSSYAWSFVPFAGRTWFIRRPMPGTLPIVQSTDGTVAGTTLSTPALLADTDLVVAGDRLFVGAVGELVSTTGGAFSLVVDLRPARFEWTMPNQLTAVGDGTLLAFAGTDAADDRELWTTDGTAAGTRQVVDVPGASSDPASVAWVGRWLVWTAKTPGTGRELFVHPVSALGATFARRIGLGCRAAAPTPAIGHDGVPHLGSTGFAITLEDAPAATAAVLAFAPALLPAADQLDCVPKLAPPVVTAGLTTGPGGRARVPLAVPNDAALIGFEGFATWIVLDPVGGFGPGAALSDVLHLMVGRR